MVCNECVIRVSLLDTCNVIDKLTLYIHNIYQLIIDTLRALIAVNSAKHNFLFIVLIRRSFIFSSDF